MNRRQFNGAVGAGALSLLASQAATPAGAQTGKPRTENGPRYAMLVYPGMILQDLVGPLTVFNLTRGDIHLVWKDRQPVSTDVGIGVSATETFETCPRDVDVFFIPGGLGGTTALLNDEATIAFVKDVGKSARFSTSVCTGSLLLGAAGLLRGKRATSHWYVRDLLALFGATPTDERVVSDGNIMTGGGVTAGIDFGLSLAAELVGEERAKRIQLLIEYDPQPPFEAGSPALAGQAMTQAVLNIREPALAEARQAAKAAASRIDG